MLTTVKSTDVKQAIHSLLDTRNVFSLFSIKYKGSRPLNYEKDVKIMNNVSRVATGYVH